MKIAFLFLLVLYCVLSGSAYSQSKPSTVTSITTGVVSDSIYRQVKAYLSSLSTGTLQDTIIIKYDFNRESCWNMLDRQTDVYIKNVILQQQQRIQRTLMARPGISVFSFREAGNKINKLKKWDQTILIDQSGNLRKWLFTKKRICGSAIILFPDGHFVYFEVDPHFEALDYKVKEIQ